MTAAAARPAQWKRAWRVVEQRHGGQRNTRPFGHCRIASSRSSGGAIKAVAASAAGSP